ncbi:hypothetical protein QVD17_28864 [Tagetes erecta]|uniref:Uncharacterized protein n=1 Tax=Tagetes erecta TaxID=13708 RepID=A0AAD8KEH9_TARER|nr:hypothetical protein QVD17_28864 [Tagetes erecta]
MSASSVGHLVVSLITHELAASGHVQIYGYVRIQTNLPNKCIQREHFSCMFFQSTNHGFAVCTAMSRCTCNGMQSSFWFDVLLCSYCSGYYNYYVAMLLVRA